MAKVKILRTSDDWGGGLAVFQWTDSSGPLTADIRTYDGSDYVWLPITYSDLDYSDPSNIGNWICIEIRVKANTVGQSDGEVQYWADGQEIRGIEQPELRLLGESAHCVLEELMGLRPLAFDEEAAATLDGRSEILLPVQLFRFGPAAPEPGDETLTHRRSESFQRETIA